MNLLLRFGIATLVVVQLLFGTGAPADSDVQFAGDAIPGGLIFGTAQPGTTISVGGNPVRVSPEGLFILGLGRNATGTLSVSVTAPGGTGETHALTVASREYDIQRIDGLPKKQVTPDPVILERIGQESSLIKAVRRNDGAVAHFANGFQWPVTGRISGVFGSQRILNGEPRSPHNGVDVAAPEGTPIVAMGDGVVALMHEDMFYTGMTVMLDHGHGLTSVYAHMSDILVAQGQVISKGTPIGAIGKTGRATGPHLHWGVTLFGTHLDPALVAGPMPEG